MARIQIEDLPVGVNLTAEEEELIFGAGLGTFRPTLESLESRQMMDAGLGYGLQLPISPPGGGGTPQHSLLSLLAVTAQDTAQQVRQLATSALQITQAQHAVLQSHIDQMFAAFGSQGLPQTLSTAVPQGQLPSFSVQGDSQHVEKAATQFLRDTIIEGGNNRWNIQRIGDRIDTRVEGNRITVAFNVEWHKVYPVTKHSCEVRLIFEGKNAGGVKQYDLVGAGIHGWGGLPLVGAQFEAVAKDLFKSKVGKIECHRFDENAFTNGVIRQAEKMSGAKEGTFVKNFVERLDGGFKIYIYTDKNEFNPIHRPTDRNSPDGRGELWLTFKYDDAQVSRGFLTLSETRQGYHYQYASKGSALFETTTQNWRDTGDVKVHESLRGAKWWTSGMDKDIAAGQQVADNALKWFQELRSADGRFQTGPTQGHVESVTATSDGVCVTLWLQRDASFLADSSIHPTLKQRVTLTLKTDGQIDGEQQYKLVDVQSQDHTDWKGHHRGAVGLEAFGTNAAELKARFADVRV